MAQAKEDVVIHPAPVGSASAPVTDVFGDPIEGPDAPPAPATRTVRALVWPRSAADNSSREIVNGVQNTVIVGLTALLPRGEQVSPDDKIFARGVMWEVEGEPGDYKRRGVMVALRRVQG